MMLKNKKGLRKKSDSGMQAVGASSLSIEIYVFCIYTEKLLWCTYRASTDTFVLSRYEGRSGKQKDPNFK